MSLLSLSSAVVFVAVVHLHEQQAFVNQFSVLVHAVIAMQPAACLECLAEARCMLVQAGRGPGGGARGGGQGTADDAPHPHPQGQQLAAAHCHQGLL